MHKISTFKIHPSSKLRSHGFTLIELLMVMAIVAILATITFGVFRGVQNAQNRSKAKVQLNAISSALEQFKSRYGDYPLIDGESYPNAQQVDLDGEPLEDVEKSSVVLLYALTGRMKLEPGRLATKIDDSLDAQEVLKAPKFIDLEKFDYSIDNNGNPGTLLDPWGNPYMYAYREEGINAEWDVFGYHLYTTGPNMTPEELQEAKDAIKSQMESNGVLNDGFRDVADAEGIMFSGQ